MQRVGLAVAVGLCAPLALAGQARTAQVVSDAYRVEFELNAGRIIAAAEDMPADRYGFRPTPAQMSFAEVVIHVLEGNDDIGATVGDTAAAAAGRVSAADPKPVLVERLKRSFAFCRSALARLTDAMLDDSVAEYGTRAQALFNTINHWSDHYSQMAIYLRLNGVLPPTARGKPMSPAPGPGTARGADDTCAGAAARHPEIHDVQPPSRMDHSGPEGMGQVDSTGCRSSRP